MAVPGFQEFMLPLLRRVADGGEYWLKDLRERVADDLGLTEADRSEMLRGGNQARYVNCLSWASIHLTRAGLTESPSPGIVRITQRGRDLLAQDPERIDLPPTGETSEVAPEEATLTLEEPVAAIIVDNRSLVAKLVATCRLKVASNPAELPPPETGAISWNRVEGMLAGLAVGDSLGNTSESLPPARRRELVGEVRDFLPNDHAGRRRVGLPSDDTQLAFWTVEQLLEDEGLVPERLAVRFASRGRIFGIGQTVRSFLAARQQGKSWIDAAQESAGNGALMRIAPVLLPHLPAPSAALWADASLAGAVTHNDHASNAACVAFVRVLWSALVARAPVPPGFWVERFLETARLLEGDEPRYVPRAPRYSDERTSMWRFTDRVVRDALARRLSAVDACDSWYSGAYLLETVPSVLYVLERHGNDPEEAIVRAVNDTRDNDTAAAIVGAAVGALHGLGGLPQRWREGLLGRTTHDDDGHVRELIEQARRTWGPAVPARPRSRRSRSSFRGCLLGGAVGDALGAPIEFMSIGEIRTAFGPKGLADYAPAYGRVGAITDDTQMTLFTAEALIRAQH